MSFSPALSCWIFGKEVGLTVRDLQLVIATHHVDYHMFIILHSLLETFFVVCSIIRRFTTDYTFTYTRLVYIVQAAL